jgi:two-component system, OmpR family, sensor kinase
VRRPALRTRVALAAAAAVFLAVAVLGGATQLLIGHELRASLDTGLKGRASDVARLSASAPALLTAPGALDAPYGGRDLVVEVLDRRRRIVARSAVLGGRLLPAPALVTAAIDRGRTGFGSVRLTGEDVRIFVAPLPDGGAAGGGAVIVGSATAELDRTRERLAKLVLASALVAALLGALAAAALTGHGMRPLRRLSAAAGEIRRTGDATRRLPPEGSGEVAELTRTLNGMLDALEHAQATERRFLADASHELRTPVTALVGNVAYLARHGGDDAVLADLLADAARLARLIDDLLVLERREGPTVASEHVDLAALAHEVAALHPGAGVRVEVGTPAMVQGDRAALARAVGNLVANAVAHGAPPVVVTVGADAALARLAVTDAGPGLPAGQAEAAFGRFWRGADTTVAGSGLGLAIVRDTARAHGGDVTVDGATFTLVLPIVRKPSSSPSTVDPMSSHRSPS